MLNVQDADVKMVVPLHGTVDNEAITNCLARNTHAIVSPGRVFE